MQCPRHQFLARSAFALDQHSDLRLSHSLDHLARLLDQLAFTENLTLGIIDGTFNNRRIGLGNLIVISGLVQRDLDLLAGKWF